MNILYWESIRSTIFNKYPGITELWGPSVSSETGLQKIIKVDRQHKMWEGI